LSSFANLLFFPLPTKKKPPCKQQNRACTASAEKTLQMEEGSQKERTMLKIKYGLNRMHPIMFLHRVVWFDGKRVEIHPWGLSIKPHK